MLRKGLCLVLSLCAAPALAQTEKETSCAHQAQVVAAVQQARLDEVGQQSVQDLVVRDARWPEQFNKIVPIVTPWIYGLTDAEVAQNDLSKVWEDGCLAQ